MNLLKFLTLTWLTLSFSIIQAQVSDNFSDGEFTTSPTWSGDTDKFIVNAQLQLQLNAAEAGRAYLSTPTNFAEEELEWRLSLKMAFSPSSSNYTRYYLASDSADLFHPHLTGYFLQCGEAGNNDAIELFYQHGDSLTSIFRSRANIAKSFHYNLKITRDLNGEWTLFADTLCNSIYHLDTIGHLNAPLPSCGHIGPACVFSSSNRNKFYFDDIYCGLPIIDSTPPTVADWHFNSNLADQLCITFSERVTDTSALEPTNYINMVDMQHPVLCEWDGNNERSVRLFFAQPLEERQEVNIAIQHITDYSNNTLADTILKFSYCIPRRNEILITEIMADPSPPVQLPEYEYIEIYNTLPFPISMKEWTLAMGSSVRTLPDSTLMPNSYAIVTSAVGTAFFSPNITVIAVSSTSLTDDGQQVALYDSQKRMIHQVRYSKNWHRNVLKCDGGWSLEMIDMQNPCGTADNWDSSLDNRGGTPGETNSIAGSQPDESQPHWVKVTVPDPKHIRLFSNETLLTDTSISTAHFSIEPEVTILSAECEMPAGQIITLTLQEELEQRVVYTITLQDTLCDCAGNMMETGISFPFGLPEYVVAGDLVINEVLSNPFGDSDADYIEIYNMSDKLLDLGTVWLGSGSGDVPTQVVQAAPDGFQLFPKQYVAITKSRDLTLQQYSCPAPEQVIENNMLPAYPNDEGSVHLLDAEYLMLDRFCYSKAMHHPLLNSTDGVSLERIHLGGDTQDETNWTSAAENCGWGTPGYRNSQYSELAATEAEILVLPDVFSPDGDGHNDFAEIYCNFKEAENCVTIDIYNRSGQRIRRLASNETVGYEARFRWDGTTDDHRAANSDIYLIHIQLWNTSGKRKSYRKSVAVVRRE